MNTTSKELDHEIKKLLDHTGKWYMAYGYPYNAYEKNNWEQLQDEKIKRFKNWLNAKYQSFHA